MGLLSTIGTTGAVLGTCAAGFFTKIAADEFAACASSWARKIVRRAARGLPEEERVASEAEWLAHVDDVPGNLSKLLHASGLWGMVLRQKAVSPRIKAAIAALHKSFTTDIGRVIICAIIECVSSLAYEWARKELRHNEYAILLFLAVIIFSTIGCVYWTHRWMRERRRNRMT